MHVIRRKFAEGSNAYRGSCGWSSPLLTCSHGIVAETIQCALCPYAFSLHSSL